MLFTSRRLLPYYAALFALLAFSRMRGRSNLSCFTEMIGYSESNENDHPTIQQQLRWQPPKSSALQSHDTSIGHRMKPFCHHWDSSAASNRTLQTFDKWFTHHPTWIVTNETNEKFCVAPGNIQEQPHIRGLLQYYANQFHSPCDKVHIRTRWSSGWGADFLNAQGGLIHALNNRIPLIMHGPDDEDRGYSNKPWHYSANKNDSSALTCEEGDTTCYFLPYHDCGTSSSVYWRKQQEEHKAQLMESEELPEGVDISQELGRNAYLFMTRKMLWFRRAVFDYKQNFKRTKNITGGTNSDCTVIHVRRSDVVLHESHTRRYFPVADYVKLIPSDKLSNPDHHIFLLTDDSNAVEEAHEFFPSLNWKYFDRPRHKGSSGGWENQTPSRNPALEVIVLMATFELAQECSAFVYGHSNFAEYIYQQMLLARSDVERYRVEGDSSVYNPLHNTSESDLDHTLVDLRKKGGNGTDILSSILEQSDEKKDDAVSIIKVASIAKRDKITSSEIILPANVTDDCKEDFGGVIIVNILGLLANDLFEAAFARRMAEELGCGWQVFYRTMWNTAFPTDKTDMCFPNALAKNNNRERGEIALYRQREAMRQIQALKGKRIEPSDLYRALSYNELEPEKDRTWDNSDGRANKMIKEWETSLGDKALIIEHELYPLQEDHVDKLVAKLKDPASPVKVLSLKAFFIHYDWMSNWMDQIADWLHIDPACCTTPAPDEDTIMIHIRDFEPEDDAKNKNLQIGVYRDIIEKYSDGNKNHTVVVVCQPKSVKTDIVQALIKEYGALVQPGEDNIDAFCILASAKGLFIPSTSSSFSELAALLAAHKNENVEVHYPTHTLDYPMVTLNVTAWKYHLTNTNCSGIDEFDVDHSRLKVRQA